MLFNFLRKTEPKNREATRSEVFSKIAEAKRNKRTSIHIDTLLPLDLQNELRVMGYSVYIKLEFSATNIYWKNP